MLWEADLCLLIFVLGNCYVFWETFFLFWEIDSYSKWFEPGGNM